MENEDNGLLHPFEIICKKSAEADKPQATEARLCKCPKPEYCFIEVQQKAKELMDSDPNIKGVIIKGGEVFPDYEDFP